MDAQYKAIGESFVQQYYNLFDCVNTRAHLKNLYHLAEDMPNTNGKPEGAKMTFEGCEIGGVDNIIQKIVGLPFTEIIREVTTVDAQPTSENGIFVQVVGRLKTDNDVPNSFIQAFILKPYGNSFFIQNDCFRLVLHNST